MVKSVGESTEDDSWGNYILPFTMGGISSLLLRKAFNDIWDSLTRPAQHVSTQDNSQSYHLISHPR